jgi:hypothetical protein
MPALRTVERVKQLQLARPPALKQAAKQAAITNGYRQRHRRLSALARKFADVFGQAARATGRSSRWASRSRSARVNFHSNGVAICS